MTGVAAARDGAKVGDASGRPGQAGLPPFELAVLALGYGLCHAWVVGFLGFAARYDLGLGGLFGYDQVYLFAGVLAGALVACLSRRAGIRGVGADGGATSFSVANLACAAVALVFLSLAALTQARPLLVAAFALCGVSSAVLQVAWGARFSLFGMRMALISVPVGAIVTAVIMMVLPDEALLVCLYVLPFLSLLLLYAHRSGDSLVLSLRALPGESDVPHGDAPELEGRRSRPVSGGTFVRLMASIAVFSLVGRCLDSFPAASVDSGVPEFVADNYAFLAILAVGLLLVVFALVFGERFDVMLVYRLTLPCMVAGLAVLTLFMDRFTVMSIAIVAVGYEFFDLLFWALLVGMVRQSPDLGPRFVFGWGVAATYVGMGAGTLLSRAVVPPILAGTLDMSALALMCILVLVVLVVLVLPEGVLSKVGATSRQRDDDLEAESEQADTLEARCEALAARCELTPREVDVLLLLARGRTLAVVARELNIAQGTARTHMMHIYSKLGVHKQQELIDMVESEGEGR